MASAVNSKTREIAELMQRLKAGEISKAELFMQLSKLQPTGSGEVAEVRFKRNGASFAASVVDNRDRGDVSSVRSPQQSLYDTDRAGVSHDQAKLMSVQQLLASRLAAEKALQRSHPSTTRVDDTREADVATAKFIPTDPFAYSPMEESPSFEYPNDDDGGATARYVHYMDEDSFHVRVSRWKQQKENLKEKVPVLKQEQLEVELTECTFQPTINPVRRSLNATPWLSRFASNGSASADLTQYVGLDKGMLTVGQARTHHTFEFKPAINKKSNDIMQQGRKGDFIERVAKYALRKEHDKLKNRSIKLQVMSMIVHEAGVVMPGQDPQCTFKPKINDVSASRAARSVTELSRGDLLRRETSQRLMKLRVPSTRSTAFLIQIS
ncbi:hypothetical protein DYB32_005878 [Aphanomyces invadans]|uniref:Uncharacterized protein n=1 Tax=Aphanomyces invadans TaxID=157072 RepID=A0A418ATA7_9STRA|nr:hypothetical protein DYB32_005878 [Aphanomyces invadans]